MKKIADLALFLIACSPDSCGPQNSDYLGCAAACGTRGVAEVTFSRCRCQGESHDGGR